MKIVTWNMGRRREAWTYLRETLKPDIALLQEAPQAYCQQGEQLCFEPLFGWGTAVYSRGLPMEQIAFSSLQPGRSVLVRVRIGDGDGLLVASLHGQIIRNRIIPQLAPLLDEIERIIHGRTAIIGGDFNTTRTFIQTAPRNGHREFFEHMDTHYVDWVWKAFKCEQPTQFRARDKNHYQVDHLFVTRDLKERLGPCTVGDINETLPLSDHVPIRAQLRVPRKSRQQAQGVS
jgi:endonuclease/exonuclease/phosphatase family metal-dependent hydrolase